MNTQNQSSPEVKASGNLTEAEVIAWLRSRAESYGIKGLSLDITGAAASSPVTARVPKAGSTWDVHYGFAQSIDDAVAKVREQIAADLRAQAAKLLAEADAVITPPAAEPQTQTADTAEKVEVAS